MKKKIGREPIEQCVYSVPRGGVKRKKSSQGSIEQCVEKFFLVTGGGLKGKKYIGPGPIFSLGAMRWCKNGKRQENHLR